MEKDRSRVRKTGRGRPGEGVSYNPDSRGWAEGCGCSSEGRRRSGLFGRVLCAGECRGALRPHGCRVWERDRHIADPSASHSHIQAHDFPQEAPWSWCCSLKSFGLFLKRRFCAAKLGDLYGALREG